jgi:hypothetical protein
MGVRCACIIWKGLEGWIQLGQKDKTGNNFKQLYVYIYSSSLFPDGNHLQKFDTFIISELVIFGWI